MFDDKCGKHAAAISPRGCRNHPHWSLWPVEPVAVSIEGQQNQQMVHQLDHTIYRASATMDHGPWKKGSVRMAFILLVLLVAFVTFTVLRLKDGARLRERLLRSSTSLEVSEPLVFKHITKNESRRISYPLLGMIFSKNVVNVTQNVTSSVLHSFEEDVMEDFHKMFPYDPSDDREAHTTTIGVVPRGGTLTVVIRMWLLQELPKKRGNKRLFMNSHFYVRKYDSNLSPVGEGYLLGIPSPVITNNKISGPEDPRLVKVGDDVVAVFSMSVSAKSGHHVDLFTWNLDNKRISHPSIVNHTLHKQEKNWCPITINDRLHFIYTMAPLQVLECGDSVCHFIYQEKEPDKKLDNPLDLRGGTPFEQYRDMYYLSVAHTSRKDRSGIAEINGHFVLLRVDQWRIVYVSDVIKIDAGLLGQIWHPYWTFGTFIYPTGILIENDDVIDIAVNIGDAKSYMIRVRGMKAILDQVIDADQKVKERPDNLASIKEFVGNRIEVERKEKKQIFASN